MVKCSNQASNRLVGARYKTSSGDSSQDSSGKDQDHFDWGKFWILLKENIAYLVVAIGSAMAVAARSSPRCWRLVRGWRSLLCPERGHLCLHGREFLS